MATNPILSTKRNSKLSIIEFLRNCPINWKNSKLKPCECTITYYRSLSLSTTRTVNYLQSKKNQYRPSWVVYYYYYWAWGKVNGICQWHMSMIVNTTDCIYCTVFHQVYSGLQLYLHYFTNDHKFMNHKCAVNCSCNPLIRLWYCTGTCE